MTITQLESKVKESGVVADADGRIILRPTFVKKIFRKPDPYEIVNKWTSVLPEDSERTIQMRADNERRQKEREEMDLLFEDAPTKSTKKSSRSRR